MILNEAMVHDWDIPPLATEFAPSAKILLESKDQILSEHDNNNLKFQDLVQEYILNLRRIKSVISSPGETIGVHLEDVESGAYNKQHKTAMALWRPIKRRHIVHARVYPPWKRNLHLRVRCWSQLACVIIM